MKLVVFSDIHYAPNPPINNGSNLGKKLTDCALPVLKSLIDRINYDIRPDAVVNLGDLIEDFNDHDQDIINLNYIWDVLKEINTPFYSIIGNHDLRSMQSRREVEQIMGYRNATFSVNVKDCHLIFLGLNVNTQAGTEEGGIQKTRTVSKEDLEWLKKDLERNTLPCMVFTHYGLAEDDMKGNYWFSECPESALLQNREEVKDVLNNNRNVIAVFSGHQHWTKRITEGEIDYYVVGSLVENVNDNGIPDGVYFDITVEQNELRVNEEHVRM